MDILELINCYNIIAILNKYNDTNIFYIKYIIIYLKTISSKNILNYVKFNCMKNEYNTLLTTYFTLFLQS